MDATSSTEERVPPLTADGTSSEASADDEQQRQQPTPLPAGASGGAAVKDESGGEEDEQVERFFALLANIRVLRGMYGAAASGADCRGRKRARDAEPPWKPAFKLEDFEEEEGDSKKKMKKVEGITMGGARRSAGTYGSIFFRTRKLKQIDPYMPAGFSKQNQSEAIVTIQMNLRRKR
ncbi:hypothetical protein PR202_gb00971 [Eleusine coracana subsp. coracana]|uniref:Uncharacterized protein n=1 Tax=Eleusine coracana subsp. coracana TaxID=191504 RepID=A0AAV5DUS2_ELECO|nr:hypothetical protein PR202_gb00971 [Eleusine coracana subsp. coracana]